MSLYKDKIPTTMDKYIGVEIECFTKLYSDNDLMDNHYTQIEEVFSRYKLDKYVTIASDGSIEGPRIEIENPYYDPDDVDEYGETYENKYMYIQAGGLEIKVLAKQSELKEVLNRVGKALKEIEADVNSTCGLHVHIDMRNRPQLLAAERLLNAQNIILKSVHKSRRVNSYCMPVDTKQYLKDKNQLLNITKYHTINTESIKDKKTIEVRAHHGTVNTDDIYKWCKFLISVVDGKFADKPMRNIRRLPTRLKNYIRTKMIANS